MFKKRVAVTLYLLSFQLHAEIYHVKEGDNLTKISLSHKKNMDEVLALNPQINNPDIIKIGQKITLVQQQKQVSPKIFFDNFKSKKIKEIVPKNNNFFIIDKRISATTPVGKGIFIDTDLIK